MHDMSSCRTTAMANDHPNLHAPPPGSQPVSELQIGLAAAAPGRIRTRPWPDLRTLRGAVLAVLLLRLGYGIWAVLISMVFPQTALEQQVGLAPGQAPPGLWLLRISVQPWLRYDAWNYLR